MKIRPLDIIRVKEGANIVDVVGDYVTLTISGRNYQGLCPFHEDRHIGSFSVSPKKNICRCFSCGKTWNSVDFIMEKENMTFESAIKYLGAKFGTYIDTDHPIMVKKSEPRQPPPELPVIKFPIGWVKDKMVCYEQNVLVTWLRSLPWTDEDRVMLEKWIRWYGVGTMTSRGEYGWAMFWYIDTNTEVTDGKMMKYLPDGHRDKSKFLNKQGKVKPTYSINWLSTKLQDAGYYDDEKYTTEHCLFGLHLLNIVYDEPQVEICICESEKTAIIMQTASQPDKLLWMATGGKGGLTSKMLKPLMDADRTIILFPDYDAYEDWKEDLREIIEETHYERIQISNKLKDKWKPELGDKADISDLLLSMMNRETISSKVHRLLGLKEENTPLSLLIDKLQLTI